MKRHAGLVMPRTRQCRTYDALEAWLELSPNEFHTWVLVNPKGSVGMATQKRSKDGRTFYDLDASDLGMVEAAYGPEAARACRIALSGDAP